jgi:hypothetical protein
MRRLRRDGRNGSLEERLSINVVQANSAEGHGIIDGARKVVWVDGWAELHTVS